MFQNRKLKLKTVEDFRVDWVDDSEQRLEPSVLEEAILKIDQVLRQGDWFSLKGCYHRDRGIYT